MNYAYLVDCYQKELRTKVVSVKDDKFVVLEDTIFYPNSGGQPHDIGKLIRESDGEAFPVIYVGKFGEVVSHQVDNQGLKTGDEVKCVLDWDRRYQLMKMHTAAHVLSRVIHDETGALTSGNQLGEDASRIDFALSEYNREEIPGWFEKANEIIKKDAEVNKSFMKREETQNISGFAAPSPHLMQDFEELRVVDIKGVDAQPCGGTHLDSLKEIGKLEFVKSDNKGKNNRRVYYKII
ncbi:alanyl-tRNA editing protein [Candidatus Woesearchaeota archaeon]|nr:alanyl-tRNA editing protein [Candidatus Woesearchaeota archaeon]